jgi:hypothetical protein
MSRAGAVMLKMAVMVSVDPMPIRSRQLQKATTSQTALTGVCVRELTLDQKLRKLAHARWLHRFAEAMCASEMCNLLREGECSVSRECPGHSGVGQHGAAASEELHKHHEEPHDGSSSLATCVEEDLCDRQTGRCGHDALVV